MTWPRIQLQRLSNFRTNVRQKMSEILSNAYNIFNYMCSLNRQHQMMGQSIQTCRRRSPTTGVTASYLDTFPSAVRAEPHMASAPAAATCPVSCMDLIYTCMDLYRVAFELLWTCMDYMVCMDLYGFYGLVWNFMVIYGLYGTLLWYMDYLVYIWIAWNVYFICLKCIYELTEMYIWIGVPYT